MKRFLSFPSLLGAVCLIAAACAGSNPVVTAAGATPENRPETIAFALHNSYVVIAERVASLVEQPTTPREVKQALIALHEVASPAAKRLRDAAELYKRLRESVSGDASTEQKIANALAALNAAITDAAPKIDAVAREIGGGS